MPVPVVPAGVRGARVATPPMRGTRVHGRMSLQRRARVEYRRLPAPAVRGYSEKESQQAGDHDVAANFHAPTIVLDASE